jgi:hypothetical protein
MRNLIIYLPSKYSLLDHKVIWKARYKGKCANKYLSMFGCDAKAIIKKEFLRWGNFVFGESHLPKAGLKSRGLRL